MSGSRKPQSTTAAAAITRRTPLKRSSTSTSTRRAASVRGRAVRRRGADRTDDRPALDDGAALLQPDVGRRQIPGAGQLVAGDVVLRDEDGALAQLLRQRDRDGATDRVEQDDAAGVRQRHGAGADGGHVQDSCTINYLVRRIAPPAAAALDDHLSRSRRPRGRPALDGHGEPRQLRRQPVDERASRSGDRRHAAEPLGSLDHADVVTPQRGHARRLQPRRAAPHDEHLSRPRGRRVPVRVLGLPPARRLADARHDGVPGVPHLAGLVAADAGPDALRCARPQLGHEVGIGDLRPGHLDGVGDPVLQRPAGLADVDHGALQDDGHPVRNGLADGPAQLDVEPGRLVEVGPGLLGRVDRAADDDQVVDDRGQLGGDGRRLVRA